MFSASSFISPLRTGLLPLFGTSRFALGAEHLGAAPPSRLIKHRKGDGHAKAIEPDPKTIEAARAAIARAEAKARQGRHIDRDNKGPTGDVRGRGAPVEGRGPAKLSERRRRWPGRTPTTTAER